MEDIMNEQQADNVFRASHPISYIAGGITANPHHANAEPEWIADRAVAIYDRIVINLNKLYEEDI